MVRVELAKGGQSLDDLRRRSPQASHPRTRERFQTLSLIASGQCNSCVSWCAGGLARRGGWC
jgi:hypothetical protein